MKSLSGMDPRQDLTSYQKEVSGMKTNTVKGMGALLVLLGTIALGLSGCGDSGDDGNSAQAGALLLLGSGAQANYFITIPNGMAQKQ